MTDRPKVVKSVLTSDRDILLAIRQLYLGGKNFDLDPAYSKGTFYGDLDPPLLRLDKIPYDDTIQKNDILDGLPYEPASMRSIVFDPPFMFGVHGKTDQNIMAIRFTMFPSWSDLEMMYRKALQEFYRVLVVGGIVAFKCQDYTDSKTTLTHCFVHNWAISQGFRVEDLFILVCSGGRVWNPRLVQRHARKYHSYWLVLKKGRSYD